MSSGWMVLLAGCVIPCSLFGQCRLYSGQQYQFTASAIGQKGLGGAEVGIRASCPGNTNAEVKFQLDTARTRDEGLIVSPSSGVTPLEVHVGVDPNRVGDRFPGRGSSSLFFTTVDQTPSHSMQVFVQVTLTTPDPPAISSVVNAASLVPAVTPGGAVLIRGVSLGPGTSHTLGQSGQYPTVLGNTTVTFNGIPAPLLSSSPLAIRAVAPYGLAGQTEATVVVTHYPETTAEQVSAAFSVPVAERSLGVFTRTQTGDCQNQIQNCDANGCTANTPENPAPPGSIVVLFATGAPHPADPRVDGSVAIVPRLFPPSKFPSLTIGGRPARLQYAGTAPYQSWGVIQVNAVVPEGLGSGPQRVVLSIDETTDNNAQQQAIIFIQ